MRSFFFILWNKRLLPSFIKKRDPTLLLWYTQKKLVETLLTATTQRSSVDILVTSYWNQLRYTEKKKTFDSIEISTLLKFVSII